MELYYLDHKTSIDIKVVAFAYCVFKMAAEITAKMAEKRRFLFHSNLVVLLIKHLMFKGIHLN